MSIIKQLNTLCLEHNVSISVAESCTSGLIASALSSISGSSKYFKGGVIAYHTDIKIDILKYLSYRNLKFCFAKMLLS